MCRLLEGVREAGARRILTVFGAEGLTDPDIRPVLGEILHYKVGASGLELAVCHPFPC